MAFVYFAMIQQMFALKLKSLYAFDYLCRSNFEEWRILQI